MYLKVGQFFSDFDESQMEFATEVISEAPVVVVDAQVSRTHFADSQLLLLVGRRRHSIAILLFSTGFLFAQFLHLSIRYNHKKYKMETFTNNRSLSLTSSIIFMDSSTNPSAPRCSALASF